MNHTAQNHPSAVPNLPRILYPIKEVAFQLGISARGVAYLIARGELPIRRIGGRILVPHSDLAEFASCDHRSLIVPSAQKVVI
jgi:excisionase family DNA binding protein